MHQKALSGREGEELASRFLQKIGYTIIAKNIRTRYGEIDLIAIDGDTTVFVEVKKRSSFFFGRPEEAVNRKKLLKIEKVGQYFIQNKPNLPKNLRIDVIAIDSSQIPAIITHIKNASA
ncbi:MAG TPA: YraN family protein [Patescibacteria group bacterium]